jgi:hypothetical protein
MGSGSRVSLKADADPDPTFFDAVPDLDLDTTFQIKAPNPEKSGKKSSFPIHFVV